MNKIFNLICCLAFFPVYLSAQIGYSLPNARGFFMSDSFSMAGVEIDDAGNLLNSKYCTVKIGPGKVVYTPYTVNKYSIDGKNIYKSFTVQINNRAERYFLKRKAKDKFELYFLQLEGGIKKFYLTKIDSSILYEIPASTKEDSSFLLKLITECPGSNNYLKFLRPNTNAIKLFLEYTKKCLENPFPKFQYGILIGLNANNFLLTTNNKIYSKLKLISDWKISLGAFMEIPLYKFNLSFHPELFYVENSCSNSFYYHQFIYNLVINYSC